ncbi:MAG: hypothetical protein R3B96_02425 [Pirellulaceae bacterium]
MFRNPVDRPRRGAPRVVEFWIGGEQHCYWDASSHAFARVSPGKLRTGSVFVELFQQDEQGDWPVEPIRTEVPNGLSFVCMAFDVKANQLLLFNRSEIVCLDLVTQRHRWTRQWSKPRPTSICWTDERIKILCGTKLVDLGQDTGEVIQELQLPDIETGRLVRDWSDRFSDEGRIVWLESRGDRQSRCGDRRGTPPRTKEPVLQLRLWARQFLGVGCESNPLDLF